MKCEILRENKNRQQYKDDTNHRNVVRIIVSKRLESTVMCFVPRSDHLLMSRPQGKLINIDIIVAHADKLER